MSQQNLPHRAIRVAAALAVLVAVMTSPIRPALGGSGPVVPNYLRRNFAIPQSLTNRLCSPSQSLQAAPVKAVRTEGEEDDLGRATGPEDTPSRLLPSAPLLPTARRPVGTGHTPTSPPLRC